MKNWPIYLTFNENTLIFSGHFKWVQKYLLKKRISDSMTSLKSESSGASVRDIDFGSLVFTDGNNCATINTSLVTCRLQYFHRQFQGPVIFSWFCTLIVSIPKFYTLCQSLLELVKKL